MGYFLLFEGMLDSVLIARDRWLKPDGILAPSSTSILMSATGDAEWYNDKINFWNDVYGFSMKAMNESTTKNAIVTIMPQSSMITNTVRVIDFDIKTVDVAFLDFYSGFKLEATSDGKLYAFVGHFDTFFKAANLETLMFSTSSDATPTHWMQTAFVLQNPITLTKGDIIDVKFWCNKGRNPRELDVRFEWDSANGVSAGAQSFSVV